MHAYFAYMPLPDMFWFSGHHLALNAFFEHISHFFPVIIVLLIFLMTFFSDTLFFVNSCKHLLKYNISSYTECDVFLGSEVVVRVTERICEWKHKKKIVSEVNIAFA